MRVRFLCEWGEFRAGDTAELASFAYVCALLAAGVVRPVGAPAPRSRPAEKAVRSPGEKTIRR